MENLRDLAIEVVDQHHDYTAEQASSPEDHRSEYEMVERGMRRALSAFHLAELAETDPGDQTCPDCEITATARRAARAQGARAHAMALAEGQPATEDVRRDIPTDWSGRPALPWMTGPAEGEQTEGETVRCTCGFEDSDFQLKCHCSIPAGGDRPEGGTATVTDEMVTAGVKAWAGPGVAALDGDEDKALMRRVLAAALEGRADRGVQSTTETAWLPAVLDELAVHIRTNGPYHKGYWQALADVRTRMDAVDAAPSTTETATGDEREAHSIAQWLVFEEHGDWRYDPGKSRYDGYLERGRKLAAHLAEGRAPRAATGHDYSLLDAVLPVEGPKRKAIEDVIARVFRAGGREGYIERSADAYDRIRSAASSESERPDA